eukprot:1681271-Prymnesium_polylepis.1
MSEAGAARKEAEQHEGAAGRFAAVCRRALHDEACASARAWRARAWTAPLARPESESFSATIRRRVGA